MSCENNNNKVTCYTTLDSKFNPFSVRRSGILKNDSSSWSLPSFCARNKFLVQARRDGTVRFASAHSTCPALSHPLSGTASFHCTLRSSNLVQSCRFAAGKCPSRNCEWIRKGIQRMLRWTKRVSDYTRQCRWALVNQRNQLTMHHALCS